MVVLPGMGPLHLTQPRYNAVSLLRQIEAHGPEVVYLASYSPEGFERKSWRDQNDLALFTVVPWAEENNVRIVALGHEAEALQLEASRFLEYLGSMPRGEALLQKFQEADRDVAELLTTPRLPEDYASGAFIEALRQKLDAARALAGEGPATGFRAQRMANVAATLRDAGRPGAVVIADVLDYPALLEHLPGARGPQPLEPSEAERARAIMDRAWRLEEEDAWAELLSQLMDLPNAEARFLAAQVYLAAGQLEDALALMEDVAHGDFSRPEYLPGYVLARLGQLYDLTGQRERALRAYRGLLALSWAPAETREIATAGLRAPFRTEPAT